MKTMKVKVTGPILRNSDGCILHVSAPAFVKEPDKVFTVPDNAFWRALVTQGALVEVAPKPAVEATPKVSKNG